MAVRILAALIVLVCLCAWAVVCQPVAHVSEPSKLEKTCFFRGAWMPCFIKDEALQPEFNI